MTKQVDVVVVGAGNAGLTAATTAAKAGLSTLLLERHNIPGGSASSFKRGRFEFEPSLHELAGYGSADAPGDVRQIFNALGVDVEMLPVKDAFRAVVSGDSGYDVTMPVGIENFVAKMEKEVPGSAQSVAAFFQCAGDVGRALNYLSQGKPDPAVLQSEHLNFMKVANLPCAPVLDSLGMPEKAQSILMTYWPYMGMPKSQFPFSLYAVMVYRYISMAAYIPKNRSHDMSLALEKAFTDCGGDVWYDTQVTQLLLKDGRCYGVRTADGSEIHAKCVIANCYPNQAYGAMLPADQVPAAAAKLTNARQLGMSGFCVYLGLNKSPEELGITDYSVFINNNPDSDTQRLGMDTLDNNEFFIMNTLNIDDPGCSPEGTTLMWVTQLFTPGVWDDITPENYKATKNRLAKGIIDRYEQVMGITIADCIEEISIATPATFARYLDTPQGSIYGYLGSGWDAMLPRIVAYPQEQFIPGLQFVGGHGMRTMGYSSTYINGHQIAQGVVKALKGGV